MKKLVKKASSSSMTFVGFSCDDKCKNFCTTYYCNDYCTSACNAHPNMKSSAYSQEADGNRQNNNYGFSIQN